MSMHVKNVEMKTLREGLERKLREQLVSDDHSDDNNNDGGDVQLYC